MTFSEFANGTGGPYSFSESQESLSFKNTSGNQFNVLRSDVTQTLKRLLEIHVAFEDSVRAHELYRAGDSPWAWNEKALRDAFKSHFQDEQFSAILTLAGSQTKGLMHLLSIYVAWRIGSTRNPTTAPFLLDGESIRKAIEAPATDVGEAEVLTSAFQRACELTKEYNDHAGPWNTSDSRAKSLHGNLLTIQRWIETRVALPDGYRIKSAKGSGKFPKSPWIAILPSGQTVSNGVYVAICFGNEGAGAIVGFATSVTTSTGLTTVERSTQALTVSSAEFDDAFNNPKEFLNGSLSLEELSEHLRASIDLCQRHLNITSSAILDQQQISLGELSSKTIDECVQSLAAAGLFFERAHVQRVICALATKPFAILTGATGTGKTRLAESVSQWLAAGDADRVRLVPVGADWTDNRNVVGYANYLRQWKDSASSEWPVFQSTAVLDHILAAAAQPTEPFFLILDEMNLSHVERYFADMLSAMESESRALHLHSEIRTLSRTSDNTPDVPSQLRLPENLFVLGTVNVDETTHMFSPKVLDRAFVIEFVPHAQSVASVFEASRPTAQPKACSELESRTFLAASLALRQDRFDADERWLELEQGGTKDQVKKLLTDLFQLMLAARRPFAFRSIREMRRYLCATQTFSEAATVGSVYESIDEAVLMKVLTRLHGSRRALGGVLGALLSFSEDADLSRAQARLMDSSGLEEQLLASRQSQTKPVLANSNAKLQEMIELLSRDQYVSFLG